MKAVVTILAASAMALTSLSDGVKCPLPGNWQLDVENSDEFDGAFDHSRWYDYPPRFPGRPGEFRFLAKNVAQSGGDLLITADKVPDEEIPYEQRVEGMMGFTCGAVKSRRKMFFPRPLHVVFDCEFAEWNGARFKALDLKTLPAVQKIDWFRHWIEK